MARRKRASMREGPLADLFRSTVEPERAARGAEPPTEQPEAEPEREEADEPPTAQEASQPAARDAGRPRPRAAAPTTRPGAGARLPAEEPSADDPRAKERLSRIFADEAHDVEGPAYGREEPRLGGLRRAAAPALAR